VYQHGRLSSQENPLIPAFSEKNCTPKISGTEEEVLDAAVQHAVTANGHASPNFANR
jgi:hypothetical protein